MDQEFPVNLETVVSGDRGYTGKTEGMEIYRVMGIVRREEDRNDEEGHRMAMEALRAILGNQQDVHSGGTGRKVMNHSTMKTLSSGSSNDSVVPGYIEENKTGSKEGDEMRKKWARTHRTVGKVYAGNGDDEGVVFEQEDAVASQCPWNDSDPLFGDLSDELEDADAGHGNKKESNPDTQIKRREVEAAPYVVKGVVFHCFKVPERLVTFISVHTKFHMLT
jgi:hypothetical protein